MAKGEIVVRTVTTVREVDGLEMGVLDDGTPFLSSRALARLAGVAPSAILGWLPSLDATSSKPRDLKLKEILAAQRYEGPIVIPVTQDGRAVNAHPDIVCMAVLEYYAFEAGPGATAAALAAFRFLARRSLREFIYSSVGYDPRGLVPEKWRQFHDRMLLNTVPRGFFSVFKEISDIVLSAIQAGLVVDAQTVPDISVGLAWGKHWTENKLEVRFGQRQKWPHTYPSYFPQAQASTDAWVYPIACLGEFRSFLQEIYLPEKYPRYIQSKVKMGALEASRAELLLDAVVPESDEPGDKKN